MQYGRGAAIVVALALLFTFLGVYSDGDDGPFVLRFINWLVTLGTGMLAAVFIAPATFDREPLARWPVPAQILLCAAGISVPVTLVLFLTDAADGRVLPLAFWPLQFGYVFVIAAVLTVGGWLIGRAEDAGETEISKGPDARPEATFLERLPVRYHGAVLFAVSSEDHYLRVHTDRGEELILMRLADALRELDGADGQQVHRSWWVARGGIADVLRENGKPVIALKSGGRAPVSRTYQKAAREVGFI